jgi:DNA-binding PadR family transcriptional regulator
MRLTDLGPGTVYPGLVRLEIHQIIKETSQDRLKNGPDGYQRYWYELADSAAADRLIARREKLATRRGPVQISLPAYQTG